MRQIFAKTENVKRVLAAMERLKSTTEDDPKMALFYSEPGYGKSRTIAWYALNKGDGVLVRAKALMTGRWLLKTIVKELGEQPAYSTEDLFMQIVDQLMYNPRPIFIDEVDYLVTSSKLIETLRDIHDMVQVPVILVGMGMVDKKLARYKHLYDRIVEIIKFTPLTKNDVSSVIAQMCEVKVSKDAVDYMAEQSAGKFRSLRYWIRKAERVARVNNLNTVTAGDIGK
jgi:DNA transposition AAA+ family ATPase